MDAEELLEQLLIDWEEARSSGRTRTIGELCADCPELEHVVRRKVEALERMYGRLFPPAQSEIDTADDAFEAHWPSPPGYEYLGPLGGGGMGYVYKARHLALSRVVAVKAIRDGSLATQRQITRFRSEASAVAALNHPNIVQVYEVGEHLGRPFFAFEYVDGGSLADWMDGRPQPIQASVTLVASLARAMHDAHQQGVVHRDLKPGNVLLDSSDRSHLAAVVTPETRLTRARDLEHVIPKIADFGVAKRLDDEAGVTHTGDVVGSPSYMAPEQALGHVRQIGPKTDVYALGAILYEMLTGRPPFVGATALETVEQVRSREAMPPSRLQNSVPADLDNICLKCLQKLPSRRYASALELSLDLDRFSRGLPVHARAVGRLEKAWRWSKRNPMVSALVGLLLFAVVGGLAGVSWEWRQAVRAERQAQSDFTQARSAVNDYLTLISEETLLEEPGFHRLREQLLQTALAYYERLISDHRDAPGLESDLANAHANVGHIALVIGPLDKARRHLQSARDLYAGLLQRQPRDPALQLAAARLNLDLADLEHETGNALRAVKYLTQVIESCRQLAPSEQSTPGPRDLLAEAMQKRARLRRTLLQFQSAAQDLKSLLDLCQELHNRRPDDDRMTHRLASTYLDRGLLREDTGDYPGALEDFDLAARLLTRPLEQNPNRPLYFRTQLRVLDSLGTLQQRLGHLDDSLVSHTSAIVIAEELTNKNPDVIVYQRDLASQLNNSANLLRAKGDLNRASELYQKSLTLYERMLDEHSTLVDARAGRALIRNNLGSLFADLGKMRESAQFHAVAAEDWKQLQDTFPDIPKFQRERAFCLANLSNRQLQIGEYQSAHQNLVAARELANTLARLHPTSLEDLASLAQALQNLGDYLAQMGDLDGALSEYQSALDAWKEMSPAEGTLADYESRLASLYMSTGLGQHDLGHWSLAEQNYDSALELLKKLAAKNPENLPFDRRLALAYLRLGKTYVEQKKYPQASEAYTSALQRSSVLYERHKHLPNIAELHIDALISQGSLLQFTGEAQGALEQFEFAAGLAQAHVQTATERLVPRQLLALAQMRWGALLVDLGQKQEGVLIQQQATEHWRRLLAINPKSARYRLGFAATLGNTAHGLRGLGDNEEAFANYSRALAELHNLATEYPGWPKTKSFLVNNSWGRARAANKLKRYADAAEDWRQALELGPASHSRLFGMERAWSLSHAGDHQAAVEQTERLVAAEENAGDANFIGAQLYGQAISALHRDEAISHENRERLDLQYRQRCVQLLRRAGGLGYFDQSRHVEQLRENDDFEILRDTTEFQDFLNGLTKPELEEPRRLR